MNLEFYKYLNFIYEYLSIDSILKEGGYQDHPGLQHQAQQGRRGNMFQAKTLDNTTQYRKTNHWPILLNLWRTSFHFFKDSSNRKPAIGCNPYMIGHVANELRHHKFREDRMAWARSYLRWRAMAMAIS